jgi:hypothetical protein
MITVQGEIMKTTPHSTGVDRQVNPKADTMYALFVTSDFHWTKPGFRSNSLENVRSSGDVATMPSNMRWVIAIQPTKPPAYWQQRKKEHFLSLVVDASSPEARESWAAWQLNLAVTK